MKQSGRLLLFPFLMAVSLLTRIPVAHYLPEQWDDKTLGLSALWYPVVGAVIAIFFGMLIFFLPVATSSWVMAILLVFTWVLITGALHLDGLADCADAIYAAHSIPVVDLNQEQASGFASNARKERMLIVLKDPASGVMAVVSLVMALLLKTIFIASLVSIAPEKILVVLFLVLVIARTMALLFVVTTPYAGSLGLGKILAIHTPKRIAFLMTASVGGIALLLLSMSMFVVLLAVLFVLFFLWRCFWLSALGGFVGDAIGALIEISEVLMLILFYFLFL